MANDTDAAEETAMSVIAVSFADHALACLAMKLRLA